MNRQNVYLRIAIEHRLKEQEYFIARNYVCGDNSVLFVDAEYAGIEI